MTSLVAVTVALVNMASVPAKPPATCSGKIERGQFVTGHTQGESLVNSAFDSLGRDCRKISELRELAESLAERSPKKGSQAVECRTLGLHAGIQAGLAEVLKGCPK